MLQAIRFALAGAADGKVNNVIAFKLGISSPTVEIYRANIMQKTQARPLSGLIKRVMLARTWRVLRQGQRRVRARSAGQSPGPS